MGLNTVKGDIIFHNQIRMNRSEMTEIDKPHHEGKHLHHVSESLQMTRKQITFQLFNGSSKMVQAKVIASQDVLEQSRSEAAIRGKILNKSCQV